MSAVRVPLTRPLAASLVYRPGMSCPGCWGTFWSIGRVTAECARCGLPMALSSTETGK